MNLSYGQFKSFHKGELHEETNGKGSYTKEVIADNAYRNNQKWITQHLRTVRIHLLQRIPSTYLQYDGKWIRCCSDIAEMLFVLEISEGHHRNLGEPLLVYNKDNSIRYSNSFFNRHKEKNELLYRHKLLSHYFGKEPL